MSRRRKDTETPAEEAVEDASLSGQEAPDQGASDDSTGTPPPPWPLEEGMVGFYRGVRSRRYTPDGEGLSLIQERLGVSRTGTYDEPTAGAVRRFNAERGKPGSVVDRDTWDALFR